MSSEKRTAVEKNEHRYQLQSREYFRGININSSCPPLLVKCWWHFDVQVCRPVRLSRWSRKYRSRDWCLAESNPAVDQRVCSLRSGKDAPIEVSAREERKPTLVLLALNGTNIPSGRPRMSIQRDTKLDFDTYSTQRYGQTMNFDFEVPPKPDAHTSATTPFHKTKLADVWSKQNETHGLRVHHARPTQ